MMIERSVPQTEIYQDSRDHRLRRLGAILAGSVVLISACNESRAPNKASESTSASVAQPDTPKALPTSPFENFKDIYGECRLPTDVDNQGGKLLRIEASECLEAYAYSDIAALNYALEPEPAKQLAEDIETTIAQVTDGLIKPNVELIEPSRTAKRRYEEANPDGCVQTGNLHAYSSYVAAATMPELNSYEKIIGFNQYPDCQNAALGIAYSTFDRYSEVLDVDSFVDKAAKNNGSYGVAASDSSLNSPAIFNPALLGTHEILHNFGLGHSGVIYPETGNIALLSSDKTLDLSEYLKSGQYIEYGAYDVMGQVNRGELDDNTPGLNSVQTYLLEWPQRALDKPTSTKPIDLETRSAKFYQTTNDSTIALLHLSKPLDLPVNSEHGYLYTKKINQIMLAPTLKYVDEGESAVSVRIYGTSQAGDVVDLGGFYGSGDYSLRVNEGLLQINLDDHQVDISYKKP